MIDKGADLGIDLDRVATVAENYLPAIADVFFDAAATMETSDFVFGLRDAMTRPEHFGGDTLSPVYGSWMSLSRTVSGFLTQTSRNLSDTATALSRAVEGYLQADTDAAKEFRQLHPDTSRTADGA